MIKLPKGIEVKEIPIEKRYRSVIAGLSRRLKILYDTIYDRYGKDGLDLIKDVSHRYGMEIAETIRKRIKDNDIKAVALYLVRIFNNVGGEGEVIEFSDKRVIIRIYRCPYPWEKPEICEAHTTMEKILVETLGKNLRYSIPKSIPKGDPYCDHLIKKISEIS